MALEPVLTPFVEVLQRAGAKAFSLKCENEIHQALNELDVLLQALRLQEVVELQGIVYTFRFFAISI